MQHERRTVGFLKFRYRLQLIALMHLTGLHIIEAMRWPARTHSINNGVPVLTAKYFTFVYGDPQTRTLMYFGDCASSQRPFDVICCLAWLGDAAYEGFFI